MTEVRFYRSQEHFDLVNLYRTSHTLICGLCGKTYLEHPLATELWLLGWNQEPFLHRLCSGELVKL